MFTVFSTPTLTLPHRGGGVYGVIGQAPEGVLRRARSLELINRVTIEMMWPVKSPLTPLFPPGQRPYGPAAKEG